MNFPYSQHPKDDVKEPQMMTIPPLRQWLQDRQTKRSLTFLQREFEVTRVKAYEMLLMFDTWHDMEAMPFPDEPEGEGYNG